MDVTTCTDENILRWSGRDWDKVMECLEMELFPNIRKYIMSNRGNNEDAKDSFQECCMVLVELKQEQNFRFEQGWKAYLFQTVKNNWLNKLKRKKIDHTIMEAIEDHFIKSGRVFHRNEEMNNIRIRIKNCLSEMNERCASIIMKFYDLYEWKYYDDVDLNEKDNLYDSKKKLIIYTRQEKYACLQKLKNCIQTQQ